MKAWERQCVPFSAISRLSEGGATGWGRSGDEHAGRWQKSQRPGCARNTDHRQQRRRAASARDDPPRRAVERIGDALRRSEEHTSELQSLMRISYAVFCLKKKIHYHEPHNKPYHVLKSTPSH